MATLGSASKPTTAQSMYGLNTKNAQAIALVLPSGGPWKITQLGAWFAGVGGGVSAKLCLWTASGTLVRSSAAFTAAGTGFALGAAYNYEKSITDYIVNGGTTVYAGWVRDDGGDHQFPHTGSGTRIDDTQTGTWPASFSGEVSATGRPGIYLEYEASNSLPTKPSLVSPADGALLTNADLTPALVFDHNDPDGDKIEVYDLQVDNSSGFGSPIWEVDHATNGISGDRVTRAIGTALAAGTTYYWRARTADGETYGPWSSTRSFKINRLPSATPTDPVASDFPVVWNNATDLVAWALAGAHAKARFKWSYSDPDGHSQSAYALRIYNAATGTEGDASEVYYSGSVVSSAKEHDATLPLVAGTQYWWTVKVKDTEWGAPTARTPFKVKFGQAMYEFAVPGGVASSGWTFAYNFTGSGQLAVLFRSAAGPGGATPGPWKSSIGQVTPNAYLNVLVRFISTTPGTGITLTDMTFNYIASAIQPERWTFGTVSTDWMLDPEVRRYGSQALRMIRSTAVGERVAYPFTKTAEDDFTVSPNTEYIASVYVKTDAPLASGVRLEVRNKGTDTPWGAAIILDDSGNLAIDTSAYREGWQRIWVHFRSADIDGLRLAVVQDAAGSAVGDKFWIDAVQLEEGATASPWKPGMVGNPVVLDVGGVMVDEKAGGIFRLRSEDGQSADLDRFVDAAINAPVGFAPYVPRWLNTQLFPNTTTLAIGGGAVAIPVIVPAPMRCRGIRFWQKDTTGNHSCEFRLFVEGDDGVLRYVPGTAGIYGPTASSGEQMRGIAFTGGTMILRPGAYICVIRNNNASTVLGIGHAGATGANHLSHNGMYLGGAGQPSLGNTIDITSWSGSAAHPSLMLIADAAGLNWG